MDTIPEGAVVNIHRKDGSSTGGREYVGVHAPIPYDGSDGPAIILRSMDEELDPIPLADVDWVDVLATPFRAGDLEERVRLRGA